MSTLHSDNSSQNPGGTGGASVPDTHVEVGTSQHVDPESFTDHPNSFAHHLIMKHSDPTKQLTKSYAYTVRKALDGILGTNYSVDRLENLGYLEVEIHTRQQSQNLLSTTKLHDIPVTVEKHWSKNHSKGVIRCDCLGDDKRRILEDMQDYSAVDIYRLSRMENGVRKPLNTYVITFETPQRPTSMNIGPYHYQVEPYIPNPRICRKCQRYGHGEKTCRNKVICAKCGKEGHSFNDCECDIPDCLYCHQSHSTTSRQCPMYQLERRILKLSTEKQMSKLEARNLVYRDCQAYVSQVPSLSSHITRSYSEVARTGDNTSRGQAPSNQSAQSNESIADYAVTKMLEHPVILGIVEEQKTLKGMVTEIGCEQKQLKDQFNTVCNKLDSVMTLLECELKSRGIAPSNINTIENNESQPMDAQSASSKRLRSASSSPSGSVELNTPKKTRSKPSGSQGKTANSSASPPKREQKKGERPKSSSPKPKRSSSPQPRNRSRGRSTSRRSNWSSRRQVVMDKTKLTGAVTVHNSYSVLSTDDDSPPTTTPKNCP